MNTNTLLPLAAASLFALCAGSMLLSRHGAPDSAPVAQTSQAAHVVDLPTVSVRPDPADLAYFNATRSARVVDLPAVKVTPDLSDLAYYQASRGAERVVTLAAVTVRPAAEDVAYYMSQQAGQVAAVQAQQVNAQLATQAASLISGAASR